MEQQPGLASDNRQQQTDQRAIALLTQSLLGQVGDEGEELGEDEHSGDDEGDGRSKLQARKPHLQGRFSGANIFLQDRSENFVGPWRHFF